MACNSFGATLAWVALLSLEASSLVLKSLGFRICFEGFGSSSGDFTTTVPDHYTTIGLLRIGRGGAGSAGRRPEKMFGGGGVPPKKAQH